MVSEVSVPLVGGGRTGLSMSLQFPRRPAVTDAALSGSSAPTQSPLESALTDTPRVRFPFSWTFLDSVKLIRLTMTMGNCGGEGGAAKVSQAQLERDTSFVPFPRGSLPSIGK